jgi:hypothetical protein
MRQAEQVEAELLAEVAAGKHQRSAMTLGQLLDEWLGWWESNGKPISPATLHNYSDRPAPGRLPPAWLDAAVDPRTCTTLTTRWVLRS